MGFDGFDATQSDSDVRGAVVDHPAPDFASAAAPIGAQCLTNHSTHIMRGVNRLRRYPIGVQAKARDLPRQPQPRPERPRGARSCADTRRRAPRDRQGLGPFSRSANNTVMNSAISATENSLQKYSLSASIASNFP